MQFADIFYSPAAAVIISFTAWELLSDMINNCKFQNEFTNTVKLRKLKPSLTIDFGD
jgi:hypothetical protein